MKAKILIIDDEKSIRYTFEKFLSNEGHAVVTAKDHNEALDCINTSDFDLIFADIILGGLTGIDVLREIRARGRRCPVVMLTGYPDIKTASEAVRLGAFDYISKPIRKETLLRVTDMALKHKALSDEKEEYRSNLEAIFRSVKDGIITLQKSLTVVEVNKAAKAICGLSRDSLGKKFDDLPHACGANCLKTLLKTIREQKTLEVEVPRFVCGHIKRPEQIVTLTASPLLDNDEIFSGVIVVVRDETRLAGLERDLNERHEFHNIIGKSDGMQRVYSLIEDLADVQSTVLITGESGTGKELVAEALHYRGGRSGAPLVKVNCAALSEGLLESELFGHVKGAFTGAFKDRTGRFQKADGGTIFLDEIGDISTGTQRRLLRVLQEMEFERVGDSEPVKVDVRVVTATNRNILDRVRRGEFREDLYYRLNVVEIKLPSLRERREDIPLLVEHFIRKFNKKLHKNISGIFADVSEIFMNYAWPGNIRELEHTLEHAFIVCRHNIITADDLPQDFKNSLNAKPSNFNNSREKESEALSKALEKTGWNKAKAARLLGIDRKTIYRKIQRHNLLKQ